MTKETAACERPRCSARDFKLTLCLAGFRAFEGILEFERGIGVSCRVVSHKMGPKGGQVVSNTSDLTRPRKQYVIPLKAELNRFSMLVPEPRPGASKDVPGAFEGHCREKKSR